MQFFFNNPLSVGVDLGAQSVKVVALQHANTLVARSIPIITACAEYSLGASETATLESRMTRLTEVLGTAVQNLKRPAEVILGIPEHQSFLMTTDTIDSGAPLMPQVHALLAQEVPLPLDALYYDTVRADDPRNRSRTVIGAAAKTYVDAIIQAVDAAGVTIAAMDFEGLASVRAVTRVLPRETRGRWLLIDCGATRTYCMRVFGDVIEESLRLPTSGNALTEHIATTLHFSPEQAEEKKRACGLDPTLCAGAMKEIMLPPFDLIKKRVEEMFDTHEDGRPPVDMICLVGGGAHLPGIAQYFTDAFHAQSILPNIFDHTRVVAPTILPSAPLRFAGALGLALRGLMNT